MALVCPGYVAARRAAGGQADLVEVIDDRLLDGGHAGAELDVAEGVAPGAHVAHVEPLADHDHATSAPPELVVHVVGELLHGDLRLGQVDLQRHLARRVGQARGGGDEADLPAHRLHHQHRVGRAGAGVLLVGGLNHARPVPGDGAVSGRVVNQLELGIAHVVVNRLRHAGRNKVQPALRRQQAHFVRRVHRVVPTDVEEISHLVRLEDLDHAVEVFAVGLLQLVSAGANRAGRRRGAQERQLAFRLRAHVQELFLKDPLDAVVAGVDRAELIGIRTAGLYNGAKAVVDDGCGATGLRDDDISDRGHRSSSSLYASSCRLRAGCPQMFLLVTERRRHHRLSTRIQPSRRKFVKPTRRVRGQSGRDSFICDAQAQSKRETGN